MIDFWTPYPELQDKLQNVRQLMLNRLNTRNDAVQQALVHFVSNSGKMLRPALFFLFTELGDQKKQDHEQLLQIASSIELLHMATLIHDDIIDDSPLRRGTTTLQAQFGKDIAVYAGDLLFTEFFQILTEHMKESTYMRMNALAMKRILHGELGQMQDRFKKENTIEAYLENISGKTAELFRLTCLQGAHFGKTCPKVEQLAGEIGLCIGLAFQIQDDILDYSTSTTILKKPVLEDLNQGVYTLPLLLAYQKNPAAFTDLLNPKKEFTKKQAQHVSELVHHYNGVNEARSLATNYIQHALAKTKQLPKSDGQKKLEKVITYIINRKF